MVGPNPARRINHHLLVVVREVAPGRISSEGEATNSEAEVDEDYLNDQDCPQDLVALIMDQVVSEVEEVVSGGVVSVAEEVLIVERAINI